MHRAGAAFQLEFGLQLGELGLALGSGEIETVCFALGELRGDRLDSWTSWIFGVFFVRTIEMVELSRPMWSLIWMYVRLPHVSP